MARPPIDLAASVRRVREGGIPLRAEERLAEEAGPGRRLFTSDLSVSEFLLTRDVGCEPIAQVMGSSAYHVGQVPDYKGYTGEIEVLSRAHREVRRAALARIWREAALVGADAVVGARLEERQITTGKLGKGGSDGGEVLEFTVVGTAIRAPFITHPPGQPVVTDLSGQDLWALAHDGFEPCAFLFDFCRYHGWHVTQGVSSGELSDANEVVAAAQALVVSRVGQQAREQGAEFVVGSQISLAIREVPCGYGGCQLDDADVDVSWFATGIRRIPNWRGQRAASPPSMLAMMPVGRRRDTKLGRDEDESEEIVRTAEEMAEIAREAAEEREEQAREAAERARGSE
jgi:uncharacterized protein YbjQ (UPF0145 family)